jgi:F-type H+-transporting ATPase subunit epsilon
MNTQQTENRFESSTQPDEKTIYLSFITPDRKLYEGNVTMVVLPGESGEFGVLPRHASFVSLLKSGLVKIYQGQEITTMIPITGGVVEVIPQKCCILADGISEG